MYYNNELYHYGVKGMKWGVRRYQRRDGSLTRAGMKKYGVEGRSYEEFKADKKYARRHGVEADFTYDPKTKRISDVRNFKNGRTGKSISSAYTNAIMGGRYKPSEPISSNQHNVKTSSSSREQGHAKAQTKGRAVVNGLLREVGLSLANGVGSQAVAQLGYTTAAAYGSVTVQSLGTLANVGKTIYDVRKAK